MSFRRDDRDDHKQHTTADNPPMSRLFVICNKSQDENDFREAFSKFGTIEEIWVVQDKYTGENKGMWMGVDMELLYIEFIVEI